MHPSSFQKNLNFFPSLHKVYTKFVFIFGKEDMFLAQSLNNERIALFLVFSSRKTLHHRFDKSRSYFSGKLKQRRETDMQTEIEAKQ